MNEQQGGENGETTAPHSQPDRDNEEAIEIDLGSESDEEEQEEEEEQDEEGEDDAEDEEEENEDDGIEIDGVLQGTILAPGGDSRPFDSSKPATTTSSSQLSSGNSSESSHVNILQPKSKRKYVPLMSSAGGSVASSAGTTQTNVAATHMSAPQPSSASSEVTHSTNSRFFTSGTGTAANVQGTHAQGTLVTANSATDGGSASTFEGGTMGSGSSSNRQRLESLLNPDSAVTSTSGFSSEQGESSTRKLDEFPVVRIQAPLDDPSSCEGVLEWNDDKSTAILDYGKQYKERLDEMKKELKHMLRKDTWKRIQSSENENSRVGSGGPSSQSDENDREAPASQSKGAEMMSRAIRKLELVAQVVPSKGMSYSYFWTAATMGIKFSLCFRGRENVQYQAPET
eukprot:gb/GECG01015056.1/.p1 GENE.gb/GECG01015056.1/~~gb/GECG01015056.1/.p1  ORF type:complete len:399 (+),score=78.16 gb/GECG01015056.1/:1-1197(+)